MPRRTMSTALGALPRQAGVLGALRSRSTTSPPAVPGVAPALPGPELDVLTPREREVLALVGAGLSNNEITDQLVLGEGTVKTHLGHTVAKLDLRDRAAVVVFAFDLGLVQPRREHGPGVACLALSVRGRPS